MAAASEPSARAPAFQCGFDEEIASVAAATAATYLPAMVIKRLPAGFVIPAQPVVASRPPSGANWVHEIKHDGYRLIVRRDGPTVRLYTRSAYDCTKRLPAIAAAAERIEAKTLTIDGEAVVLGPDGLSRFDELRRREAARTAIFYPGNMPQAITVTDAQGRWAVYVPLRVGGKIVVLEPGAHRGRSSAWHRQPSRQLCGL
jgi:hypothetical protein